MTTIDATHDPALTSWVPGADGHPDFPIQNLPYGIFSFGADDEKRPAVAIGDKLLDLAAISGLLPVELRGPTLNALFALPAERRLALRRKLSELLSNANHRPALEPHLHDQSSDDRQLSRCDREVGWSRSDWHRVAGLFAHRRHRSFACNMPTRR